MPDALIRNWWSLVIRGLVAILFGLITFAWPGITLVALVFLYGAYALIDGIVSLVGVFRATRTHERWGWLLFEGIAGIAAGIITFLWPAITAFVLVIIIATWAIVTGLFEIAAAIRLRKVIAHEWLLILSGVVSLLLGVLFLAAPLVGALAIALWVGAYAVIFGGLLVALGLRLRHHGQVIGTHPMPSPV